MNPASAGDRIAHRTLTDNPPCRPHMLGEAQSYRRRATPSRPVSAPRAGRREEVDITAIDGMLLPSPAPGQPAGAASRPGAAAP